MQDDWQTLINRLPLMETLLQQSISTSLLSLNEVCQLIGGRNGQRAFINDAPLCDSVDYRSAILNFIDRHTGPVTIIQGETMLVSLDYVHWILLPT